MDNLRKILKDKDYRVQIIYNDNIDLYEATLTKFSAETPAGIPAGSIAEKTSNSPEGALFFLDESLGDFLHEKEAGKTK